jgi:hypothetical protein
MPVVSVAILSRLRVLTCLKRPYALPISPFVAPAKLRLEFPSWPCLLQESVSYAVAVALDLLLEPPACTNEANMDPDEEPT